MSFKEALANFINGYEEAESKPTEEPEAVEEEATDTVEGLKDETNEDLKTDDASEEPEASGEPEHPAKSPEEGSDSPEEGETETSEPVDTQTAEPGKVDDETLRTMSEMILDNVLTPGAAKALTDEKREELLALPAGDFIKAVKEFNSKYPPVSGRIAKASKPKKQEAEEDWTLALFNS